MTTWLLNLAVLAVMIWVLRTKFAGRRQVADDLSAAAAALGLTEGGTSLDAAVAEAGAALEESPVGRAGLAALAARPGAQSRTFEGRVDGVRVSMAIRGHRHGQNSQSLVTALTAHAEPVRRLGLHLERQHGMDRVLQPGRQHLDQVTGDDSFDARVFVQGTDAAGVQALLGAANVRTAVADFLRDVPRSYIDDQGVHAGLAGPVTDVSEIRPVLTRMAGLVRALDSAPARLGP